MTHPMESPPPRLCAHHVPPRLERPQREQADQRCADRPVGAVRKVVAVERRRDASEEEHDDLDLVGRLDAGGAQPREDNLIMNT